MTVTRRAEDLGGYNPNTIKKQFADLRDYNAYLIAQVRALGGNPKKPDDPFDSLSILEMVALALSEADEASSAVQSIPFDPAGHHTPHPDDRGMPGAPTRAARYQRTKLVSGLERSVQGWANAKQNDFRSIRKQAPMTRCRNEGNCKKANRWVKAWDEKDGANEFCGGCGHRLPPPDDKT